MGYVGERLYSCGAMFLSRREGRSRGQVEELALHGSTDSLPNMVVLWSECLCPSSYIEI